ncbi:MAG: hypothetical protein ACLTZT_16665 [Butyricimonas faecalis]
MGSLTKNVLANGEQVSDECWWLPQKVTDQLTVEYNWLYGRLSGRYALFLQFQCRGLWRKWLVAWWCCRERGIL